MSTASSSGGDSDLLCQVRLLVYIKNITNVYLHIVLKTAFFKCG